MLLANSDNFATLTWSLLMLKILIWDRQDDLVGKGACCRGRGQELYP